MQFNKEIYRMRLTITTDCICRCRYCIIHKSGEYMKISTGKAAVELLISSPGKRKLLLIYGGEPLLCFDRVKTIVIYAAKLALKEKKELIISLATNGLLIEKNHLHFFKEYNVRLSVSIIGSKKYHNKYRIYKNGQGTFNKLSQKLNLIFEILDKKNISILFCVYPRQVKAMFSNFLYFAKKGFKNINIECIYNTPWLKKDKVNFILNFQKIVFFLVKQIKRNEFIFINSLNKVFGGEISTKSCLFSFLCLEVYPNGELAFYPYISESLKDNAKIGNISMGIFQKYLACRFNKSNLRCQACSDIYFQNLPKLQGREIFDIRNKLSQKASFLFLTLAKKQSVFTNYISEAAKRKFE